MIDITLVSPQDLTDTDIEWLIKGCDGAWDKATAKHQVDAAITGVAGIYRVSGNAEGIFVLAIGNKEDRELVVTAIAGKGLIYRFSEVYKKIRETARNLGAARLSGFVSNKTIDLLYRRHTRMEPVMTRFVEELK